MDGPYLLQRLVVLMDVMTMQLVVMVAHVNVMMVILEMDLHVMVGAFT